MSICLINFTTYYTDLWFLCGMYPQKIIRSKLFMNTSSIFHKAHKAKLITIIAVLVFASSARAQLVEDFHTRLNNAFGPQTKETVTQQLIYGTVEAVAAYQLGGLITKVDRKAIANLSAQIALLRDSNDLPPNARESRIKALKREMRALEGGIAKRMGRGSVKLLVRGAQLFLILDIGSRFYVLNALENKDPSYVPINRIFCSQFECINMAEHIMSYSNQAYHEIRGTTPRAVPRTSVRTTPAPPSLEEPTPPMPEPEVTPEPPPTTPELPLEDPL